MISAIHQWTGKKVVNNLVDSVLSIKQERNTRQTFSNDSVMPLQHLTSLTAQF